MPYPTLPFSSEWETPINFKVEPNVSRYGDSGVRQAENISINPLKKSFAFKITLKTKANVDMMDLFLSTNIGKPIKVRYTSSQGGSADDGNLYRFNKITQVFISPSCSTFSIELTQVRHLKL